MSLMKRLLFEQADSRTRKILNEISDECNTVQRYARPPERFKLSLPEQELFFNRTLSLYLMCLDSNAILHVAYTHTHFISAAFLAEYTVEQVWDAFLYCWAADYNGFEIAIFVPYHFFLPHAIKGRPKLIPRVSPIENSAPSNADFKK